MMNRPQNSKLLELRHRTDRDLVTLIDRRIDAGLRAEGDQAEKIYLEVAPLLLLANAEPVMRRRLESKLARLEEWFGAACA